ncbi:hypothetical protein CR194_05195 [Salipaludibacillus keqinensis]|uniref:Uncharacterized protein n=1 Tax=Salipaludibacillus keqinensis TaxID=2045207 RepID=A0A323TK15_9BACI|nr:hypothetical protein [Salipaludibacillus keqinensis]PYZ94920.1 hypothetical protein CR194_05195 [Salipaludibacillus keqinensis]
MYLSLNKKTYNELIDKTLKLGDIFFSKGSIQRYKKDEFRLDDYVKVNYQYNITNLEEIKIFDRFLSLMFSFRPEDKLPTVGFKSFLLERGKSSNITFQYYSKNENEFYYLKGKYRYPILDGYVIYKLNYNKGWMNLTKLSKKKIPTNINKYIYRDKDSDGLEKHWRLNVYKYENFYPSIFIENISHVYYGEHLSNLGIKSPF